MILSPEVLTIIILNIIFLIFGTIAFILSIRIFFNWNVESTSQKQYTLEKQSFLSATIIKYILSIKILLFIFFIFTLDKISNVLTGAMCAAGVVDATSYGIYLLLFKLINIYLFGFWLIIHNFDIKTETLKFTKLKFGLFLFIYFLFISEIVLEITMFSSIDVAKLVSCCGTLYSNTQTSYLSSIFMINSSYLLISFYSSLGFLILFYLVRNDYLYIIFNLIFLILAIITLITFFGTYIYELPTHHCPFCMLQNEYSYVGYILYLSLFVGTFYGFNIGISNILTQDNENSAYYYKMSLVFILFYTVLVSYYTISYYLKNGVFL